MIKIKGQINSSSLILVYTIHQLVVHRCIKSQLCRPHSFCEKYDEKFNV